MLLRDGVDQVFVGRERELAEFEGAIAAASQGGAAVVLVVGEAGIGKSPLVARLLGPVHSLGVHLPAAQVLALVEAGQTNQQTAQQLGMP